MILEVVAFLVLSLIVSCVYFCSIFPPQISWVFTIIGFMNGVMYAQLTANIITTKK